MPASSVSLEPLKKEDMIFFSLPINISKSSPKEVREQILKNTLFPRNGIFILLTLLFPGVLCHKNKLVYLKFVCNTSFESDRLGS